MKARNIRRRAYPKRGYKNINSRCSFDWPGCPICDWWHFYDKHGRFPHSFDEYWNNKREATDDRT